jgi:cardiolipin synthase (CMP-forming)
MIKIVPNLITMGRIISVPFIISFLLDAEYLFAFWLFFIAGASDGIDGYLAKRFDARTRLGAYMDPVADKALLTALYVSLGVQGILPAWLVVLVVSRDVSIIGSILLSSAMGYELEIRPQFMSKVNTLFQITFVFVVLASLAFSIDDLRILTYGVPAVAATTLLSWLGYLWSWVFILSGFEDGETDEEEEAGE